MRYLRQCHRLTSGDPLLLLLIVRLLSLVSLLPGVMLAFSILLVAFDIVKALLTNQRPQADRLALLVLLSILWYAYIHVPAIVKEAVRAALRRKGKNGLPP